MYNKLANHNERVVGTKQVIRLIKDHNADVVFIADDADEHIRQKIIAVCEQYEVKIQYIPSMLELGTYCNIDVGSAAAATKKL